MPREDPTDDVFAEIDDSLRKAYEQMLEEEIPDRFIKLIQKLKSSEHNNSGGGEMS